jgi:hypothetical protein
VWKKEKIHKRKSKVPAFSGEKFTSALLIIIEIETRNIA